MALTVTIYGPGLGEGVQLKETVEFEDEVDVLLFEGHHAVELKDGSVMHYRGGDGSPFSIRTEVGRPARVSVARRLR